MGVSSLVDGFAHLEGLVARLLDAIGHTLTVAERERLVDAAWEADNDALVPLITTVQLLANAPGVALEEEDMRGPLLRSNEGFTRENRSWFHVACARGDVDAVKAFVERCGLDPTRAEPDRNAQTPLHVAAERGHLEIVAFLLKYCYVDLLKRDSAMRTPLECAEPNDHSDIAGLIQWWDPPSSWSLDKGQEEEKEGVARPEPSVAGGTCNDLNNSTPSGRTKKVGGDVPLLERPFAHLEGRGRVAHRLYEVGGYQPLP